MPKRGSYYRVVTRVKYFDVERVQCTAPEVAASYQIGHDHKRATPRVPDWATAKKAKKRVK